jgi:hypothetical protein
MSKPRYTVEAAAYDRSLIRDRQLPSKLGNPNGRGILTALSYEAGDVCGRLNEAEATAARLREMEAAFRKLLKSTRDFDSGKIGNGALHYSIVEAQKSIDSLPKPEPEPTS